MTLYILNYVSNGVLNIWRWNKSIKALKYKPFLDENVWPSLFFPTVRMHVPGGLRLNSNDHLFVEVSQCFSMFWNKSL